MRRVFAIMIALLGIGIFAPGVAAPQPAPPRTTPPFSINMVPTEERLFATDWHQDRPGVLSGCVYNRYDVTADRVRVAIDGLDATGAIVANTAVFVSPVPAQGYSHFEVPVLTGASKYRVKILSFDWPQAR